MLLFRSVSADFFFQLLIWRGAGHFFQPSAREMLKPVGLSDQGLAQPNRDIPLPTT